MRTFLLIILTAMIANVGMAQKTKVLSSFNYLKDGRLDKAKEMIDAAAIHQETMNDAKTWLYKGNVYINIALTKEEKYKNLDPNALEVAYQAYQKSIELDKDFNAIGVKISNANIGLSLVADEYYNRGVTFYNAGSFDDAKKQFEITKKINGSKDTAATFLIATCALKLNNVELAEKYLKELGNRKDYANPQVFTMLTNIYASRKDTASMLNVVKAGRKRFPENLELIISETNYYLLKGEYEKAKELLQQAIAKNPDKAELHYAIGANYDALAQDTSRSMQDREKLVQESEKAYQKSIELNPKFFDAYFNLGALYFNQGVAIFNEANKLPVDKVAEYEEAQKQYLAYWQKAMIPLEKANEIDPNDIYTINSLKEIYARLNMPEKLKVAMEYITKIKAGEKITTPIK